MSETYLTYLKPGFKFDSLKVEDLKPFLRHYNVTIPTTARKPDLVKLAMQLTKDYNAPPKGGNADAAGSNGGNAENTNAAGSNGGNTENTELNGRNAQNTNAPGSDGDNAQEASSEESVRTLNGDKNTSVATVTGGDKTDIEYEQALAEFRQKHKLPNELDDQQETLSQLADAKKRFVQLSSNGASDKDLNDLLDAIKKLENLSQPQEYDEEGYSVFRPNVTASPLTRAVWMDDKRAIISCGPPSRAIWRVVQSAEIGNNGEANDWFSGRIDYQDRSSERPTPTEAQRIIGVAFESPIVVGLSIDWVFEKRSPKSREDKVNSLPANTTTAIKHIVENKHRRHVHVIISYTRSGVYFKKHLPFTHWLKISGLSESVGLALVMGAAKDNKNRWEAWLEKEHPDNYKQLDDAGLEFQLKQLQDSTSESKCYGSPHH